MFVKNGLSNISDLPKLSQPGINMDTQSNSLNTTIQAVPTKSQPVTDIKVTRFQVESLSWQTNEEIQMSLNSLYQYAEARAKESIDWYLSRKNSKARGSRWLRIAAIFLTTLGGLAPIIVSIGLIGTIELWGKQLNPSTTIAQAGYLLLGFAAACVGADRYFGFSSGWMRYITTALLMEKLLSEFRLEWAMLVAKLADKPPTADQVQLMLQRLKQFVLSIDAQVEQETQAWVAEFQSSLSDIEKTAKAQGEAARPGAIDISVTNGMEAEDGFTVSLDGMVVGKVRGTKHQIGYVPPGPHKVFVTGMVSGKPLDASELVNVLPGAIAKVTLALPVEEAQP